MSSANLGTEIGGIPHDVIVNKMNRLRSRVSRLNRLRIELEALERLVVEATAVQYSRENKRFGPTQAVIRLLQSGPRSQREVVQLLAESLDTRSDDPQRVLNTTIGTMQRRGRLYKRHDGTLEVVVQEVPDLLPA